MDHAFGDRVGDIGRRIPLVLVLALLLGLVPVVPADAEPDFSYSYDFSGLDDDPWEAGWSFSQTSSDPGYLEPPPVSRTVLVG